MADSHGVGPWQGARVGRAYCTPVTVYRLKLRPAKDSRTPAIFTPTCPRPDNIGVYLDPRSRFLPSFGTLYGVTGSCNDLTVTCVTMLVRGALLLLVALLSYSDKGQCFLLIRSATVTKCVWYDGDRSWVGAFFSQITIIKGVSNPRSRQTGIFRLAGNCPYHSRDDSPMERNFLCNLYSAL